MKGRRVHVDQNNNLYLSEGDYGFNIKAGCWQARPYGHHTGDLSKHTVVEHKDGTITVLPSILIVAGYAGKATKWHGYLERGVWGEC